MTCCFNRELRNVFVGDGVIANFFASNPLLVSENEAALREDEQVSHDLEGSSYFLSLNENRTKLFLKLARLYL